jgi:hypothetical protein
MAAERASRAAQILARAFDDAAILAAPTGAVDGMAQVALDLRGERLLLRPVWAGDGKPQSVRRAIESVSSPWPHDVVVVAKHLSPASLDILRSREANWADETGHAQIVGPGVVVLREGEAPAASTSGLTWSRSSVEIAEALLSRAWPRGIGTGDVARTTGWSTAQATQVLQAFDARGWTTKRGPQRGPGSSRALLDVDGLLDAWASAVAEEPIGRRLAHGLLPQPLDLLRGALGESLSAHVRWAITGWGAAELLAPIMTAVPTLQIRVAEEDFSGALSQAMHQAELREVDEGGAIEFWSTPATALRLVEPHDAVPVVSSARAYADLLHMGGRGVDAAEHVRREVIAPLHQTLRSGPPSDVLVEWERASRERMRQLVRESEAPDPYVHGSWAATYRLHGLSDEQSLPAFRDTLSKAVGSETGWPSWWLPTDESRPRVVDGTIECWISPRVFMDPSHRDFWRAHPAGRMFLLRGFEEDGGLEDVTPGTALDLMLPIWRIGECLLHARRLARELGADRIEFAVRWEGLQGRRLRSLLRRDFVLPSQSVAADDHVTSQVEVRPAELEDLLPQVVRALVEPLYATFDFYRPPDDLYRVELERLRRG